MAPRKKRLDTLLVERGLAATRAKAQALVMAGHVFRGEARLDKPGSAIPVDAHLELRGIEPYVSRGGRKLEGALDDLALDVASKVCADIGASTGGFTDCLLQRGARRVYAVDVGRGQLAESLKRDPRVVVIDEQNARYLDGSAFDDVVELATVDVSFISVTKLLAALASILPAGARSLMLVKPQFEVGKSVAKRYQGVVPSGPDREAAIEAAVTKMVAAGFRVDGRHDCRVPGPKGNVEHFVLATRQ